MPFDPQAWAEADSGGGGEAPPDGLYEVELADAKIVTTRADEDKAIMTWRVISGPHRDSEWETWHTFEPKTKDGEPNPGIGYTKQMLRTMRFPVDDPSASNSLDAIKRNLAELVGKGYTIDVKRNGTFVNVYARGVLDTYAPSLPGSGGDDAPTYGQPRQQPSNAIMGHDGGGVSAPPQTLADAGRIDVERTGESDVTKPADVETFTHEPVQKGDIDPETGEPIPF